METFIKTARVGNTTLKFNSVKAVKTQEGIKKILDSVAAETQRDVIAAAVKENTA